MKLYNLKRTMTVSAFGLAVLLGASGAANAQNDRRVRRQPPQQEQSQQQPQQDRRRGERVERQEQRIDNQRQTIEQQRQREEEIRLQNERERQEQIRLQNERNRNYNYDNRGYNNNYGVERYRVYRNGGYYNTDSRGAELLRQAVNNGYEQGVRAGQADRYNRRGGGNYRNNSIYRSGNYGYQSYVDASQYQYYFQQGFDRGYEDGYDGRFQYGTNNGGAFNILGNILSGILNIQSY